MEARFAACKLVMHPQKTQLVYCKDVNRRGDYPNQSFDFLGYRFRPRKSIWRWVSSTICGLFPACCQSKSAEGHGADASTVAFTPSERQIPARSSPAVQQLYSWLDQLLPPLLWIGPSPGPPSHRRLPGPLGTSQIQANAPAAKMGTAVVGAHSSSQPGSLCPLAFCLC